MKNSQSDSLLTLKCELLFQVTKAWAPYISVLKIAQHASDVAPKRILRLSVHRLQIFLVKYEYLRSLQLCEDQRIRELTP